MSATKVRETITDQLQVVAVENDAYSKYHITARPNGTPGLASMFRSVADFVDEKGARVIHQFVFGGSEFTSTDVQNKCHACGGPSWPITWITGKGPSGSSLTGTQLTAVSHGLSVVPVEINGRSLGHFYEDKYARYCILGDLRPADPSLSRALQTELTFALMDRALRSVGMSFSDVARTWFYLDRILDWYDTFNEVRTDFFSDHGVFDQMVPASTGVGARNASGTALVADLMAIRPKDDRVKVFAVPSPLQCPAIDYKSSFSRAVEIDLPDQQRLYVSGTASIAPEGETAHVGDIARQIELTMEVIEAILASRSAGWEHMKKAVVYMKDLADAPAYEEYRRAHKLPEFPTVLAHADICRPDLLFEVEVETVKAL